MITMGDAIKSIYPDAEFAIEDDNYKTIRWLKNKPDPLPTFNEISTKITELQTIHDSLEYQRLRAKEYPPVEDYLDAVVKGDLAQQQAYIDACLAVKTKYPKPEGI